jgi:hypothetical protein
MRDDGVDTRVHGTQASATESTACRCRQRRGPIPTQGEGSPQNVGDAWLRRRGRQPGSHVVTSRDRGRPRTRNLRCRVHRNRHPNHQDAGLAQQPDAAAAPAGAGMRCWMAAVITGQCEGPGAGVRHAGRSARAGTRPTRTPTRHDDETPPPSCPRPDRPLTPFRDRAVVELHDVRGRRNEALEPDCALRYPSDCGSPDGKKNLTGREGFPNLRGDVGHRTGPATLDSSPGGGGSHDRRSGGRRVSRGGRSPGW